MALRSVGPDSSGRRAEPGLPGVPEFGLLGELSARIGGVAWRRPPQKPRRVLAALLLEPGAYVPIERLVDVVWNEAPPRSVVGAIQVYVSHLRRALPGVRIHYRSKGYLIDVEPDSVDLHRFRTLVARSATAEPAEAVGLLRRALALFRGEPLAGVGSDLLGRDVVPVVEEERMATWEVLFDAEFALDRAAKLVPELIQLTRRYPLRERFHEQLMLAQYDGGRGADAAATYRRARRLLREELGIGPGQGLEDAYRRVLRGRIESTEDGGGATPGPAPGVAASTVPDPPDDRPGPHMLPRELDDFTGREPELARATAIVRTRPTDPTLLLFTGMAGVGKTALAIHLAHRLGPQFRDGQLFIDLAGYTVQRPPLPAGDALVLLLGMLGVPADRIPADPVLGSALWRATLARRRMVIVLDNAADANQIMPLLPGTSPSLVLVTSRASLPEVDAAYHVPVDVLGATDATALFAKVAGVDPAAGPSPAMTRAVELCGHLPLAIRLAASRLRQRPTWPVQELVERLSKRSRLDELSVGNRGVDLALDASYRTLPAPDRRVFRLLSLAPGPDIDAAAAGALAGLPQPVARRILEHLLDENLLQQRQRNRFRLPDLIRQYSADLGEAVDSESRRRAATGRLLEHYLAGAQAAGHALEPGRRLPAGHARVAPASTSPFADPATAAAWLAVERPNLLAAVHSAAAGWPRHAWQLVAALRRYFVVDGCPDGLVGAHQRALAAARSAGDLPGEASVLHGLGVLRRHLGAPATARLHHRRALRLRRAAGDRCPAATRLDDAGRGRRGTTPAELGPALAI